MTIQSAEAQTSTLANSLRLIPLLTNSATNCRTSARARRLGADNSVFAVIRTLQHRPRLPNRCVGQTLTAAEDSELCNSSSGRRPYRFVRRSLQRCASATQPHQHGDYAGQTRRSVSEPLHALFLRRHKLTLAIDHKMCFLVCDRNHRHSAVSERKSGYLPRERQEQFHKVG